MPTTPRRSSLAVVSRRVRVAASLGLLAVMPVGAADPDPVLVKDVAPGTASAAPTHLVNAAGTLFFFADRGDGYDLWKSDGTRDGTQAVSDPAVHGPFAAADGQWLVAVGARVYWIHTDPDDGSSWLWTSDGTSGGTQAVLGYDAGVGMTEFTPVGGTLYFTVHYGGTADLYKAVGATANEVKSFAGPIGSLANVNGTLFFQGFSAAAGAEPWKSDGTAGGTVLIKDVLPGVLGSNPASFTSFNGKAFFAATGSGVAREPWMSDGTAGGTMLVKDICPGSCASMPPGTERLVAAGPVLYLLATDGTTGRELWKSDGTAVGTAQVKDISPYRDEFTNLTAVDNTLYFVVSFPVTPTERRFDLWKSIGTAGSTVPVREGMNPDFTSGFIASNGKLLFTNRDLATGYEPWTSDGSSAGTALLSDLNPGAASSFAQSYVAAGAVAYFVADDGTRGFELWKTDGTAGGTTLVRDINEQGFSSEVRHMRSMGGILYFSARNGTVGRELWRSDGSSAGTVVVKDVAANSLNGSPVPLGVLGGSLVFRAWDHLAGGELWKTDGTTTGTVQVKDIRPGTPESMPESVTGAVARDRVFFAANDGVAGTELWKTDGTPGGTVLVKDINPGAASSAPTAIVTFGDRVFFLANDGTHGVEIWVSDGTGPGTTLVKDVAPGASAGASGTLVAMGDALYFTGNDGATGLELWKTSGTPVGTARVRDIRPGAEGSAILHLTASGGTLYFTADDGTHGQELWRSNGTDGGTALVADLAPGPGSTLLGFLTDLNGAVLFDADVEPHGAELWRSDGSAAGTVLVKDINPGPDDSLPADLYAANGRVYFSAADDSAGGELWETDGSAAGTRRLADVWPGEESGNPSDFILVGTTLYFRATGRASEGDELWKLDVTPNPPALDIPSGAIAVGASNTVTGTNFTPGSVIKLFVATSSGVLTYGPYTPSAATATSFTWTIPASVALGTGFVALQVINTDTGYLASNVVGALLIGAEVALVPTIARINGVGLAPPDLSIPVAHIDTVVAQGATVTIEGTAFIDPVVNLFTASGNVGPLFPLAGATPNRIQVVIPPTAPTGPGNFQVVNRPSFLVSNAVASTIGAVPSISSVSAAGGVITVRGAGFSTVSVINLFNLQGGAAVNLGGLDGGGPRIPLTVLSDSEFRFARPAGAAAGPSFIEVLNPPFIPFSSSGPDPDGAFSMPPPPPLVTEVGTDVDGAAPADTGSPSRAGSAASGGAPRGELVRWRHAVRARVEGHLLTADDGGADDDDRTPAGARRAGSVGTAWQAGASSTRALVAGPGDLTWTVRAGAGDVALGLTHDDTVPTLADIDYGFRLDAATHELAIVEGGAVRAAVGTYAAGDRLRIAVRTDQVEYRRNGQLVWTSACAPRYPLVADASLGSPEARLAGVRLGGAQLGTAIDWAPAAQPARETARVAAAGPLVLRATAPLAAGGAVQAVLTDGAGIGVGAAEEGCAYCLVRDGTALRLVHAGATRRTWAADPGAVVRVEVTADGLVRYWAGETRLDEAWIAPGDPLGVRGVLNGPGSAVAQAVLTDP